jgi:phospholipid transport system substrate-binding protein
MSMAYPIAEGAVMSRILAAILLVLTWSGAALADAEGAKNFITKLGDKAVGALKSNASQAQKHDAIEEVFRQGLDIDTISRFVLGRHWQQATPQQREAYQEAFRETLVQRYTNIWAAQNVTGYTITGVRDVQDGDTIVQTEVDRGNQPKVNFGWRVRGKGNDYKVVDVIVDGVSMVVTQRSDFASVLQRQSLDQLIEQLKQRAG